MLQISNLTFSYQSQPIFHDLHFSFSVPEIIAIIGDNGSGKTTLLRLIAGELTPDDGAIKLRGTVSLLHQVQPNHDGESGGERTKAALTELFRQHPDILLLDEPTNNLDSEHQAWLVSQLHVCRGLILIVSHDRNFIDQVAAKVLWLHDGKAELFSGNYSDFLAEQNQKLHNQDLLYEKTQRQKRKLASQLQVATSRAHKSNRRSFNKIRDESKLVSNGKRMGAQNSAGKTLRAVQSKIDQLSEIERPFERKTYHATVSSNLLHHKKLLNVTNLSKSYPGKVLFSSLNFTVHTGERIRISGRNGSGKSTLFKLIMRELLPDAGAVTLVSGINLTYVSQEADSLDGAQSFLAQCADFDRTEIYRAGATMDLSPQDLTRPVIKLSHGQQVKLAILRLILQPVDLAILDELTNHLDIRARENIEAALADYPGALLVATHDEAFASALRFDREIILESKTCS